LATATVDLTQALGSGALQISGDPTDLQRLVAVLDPGDPDFPIVTPREEV
jgi:alkyl sulfatase BDS1-like metallo-beta-lactamase superfamily hydrolase